MLRTIHHRPDRPHPAPLPAQRAQRVSLLPPKEETRDLIIAGVIGMLIVSREALALIAGAAFIVALGTAGLIVGNNAGIAVEQPHLVSEVLP